MPEKQRGVTLIELMVVVACLAIFAAIAVPNWIAAAWPAYRLNNAARQVVSDLRYARMRSIATNRQYRLRFNPISESYLMEQGDCPSGSLAWTVEGMPQRFGSNGSTFYADVDIVGEEEYTAVFRPTGGMTSITITLQNTAARTTKVVCSMAGRIRVIKE